MTLTPDDFLKGGFLADKYGRRQLVPITKNEDPLTSDLVQGDTITDADHREQIALVDRDGEPIDLTGGGGGGDGGSLEGYLNVKAEPYGAVGDGVADDTVAIQAAIDAAKLNGGVVWFPPGTYKITAALNCNSNTKAFRLTGAGAGRGHVNVGWPKILWTGGAGSGPVVKCYSIHGFEIDHLHFAYNNAAYNGHMIDVDGGPLASDCVNWHLHHLSFRGDAGGSLQHVSALSNIRLNRAIIGNIDNIQFAGAVNPLRLGDPGGSYVVAVQIEKCGFNFADDAHILIASGDAEAIAIRDCTFEAGVNTTAIRGATTAGDGGQNTCYQITIENNWFGDASDVTTWIKDLHPIGPGPIVVANNYFGGTEAGSHLSGDGNWLITGNLFTGGTVFSVFDAGGGEHPVFIGNWFAAVTAIVSGATGSMQQFMLGNTSSYNPGVPQSDANTPHDRFGHGRLAVGGSGGVAGQPEYGPTTGEDLVFAAWANALTLGTTRNKGLIGVGKTPNPNAIRSIVEIAPWTGSEGGWTVMAGAGPYQMIEAWGGASQAACRLGFNGATPVTKPTGVAVTAAGIHAALVSLGLIAA